MLIEWMYNGKVENIPPIGKELEVRPHLLFVVDGYGETKEVPGITIYAGQDHAVLLQLEGHFKVPAGSPMEVLEMLLNGQLEELLKGYSDHA